MNRIEDEQQIVRDLGVMQLGKLRANKHKPNWRTHDLGTLMSMLDAEVAELREAIRIGKRAHVALECADVANLAAMIADWVSAEKTPVTP